MAWYDAIPIVGPLIGGLVDTASNHYQHNKDVERQQAWRDEDMEREDSSYQRTADDMRKAGLSPSSLSAGTDSGAVATSNPVSTPQNTLGNAFNQLGSNMLSEKQFNETVAQNWANIGINSKNAETQAQANKITQEHNRESERLIAEENARKEKERVQAQKEYNKQVATRLFESGSLDPSMTSDATNRGLHIVGSGGDYSSSSSGVDQAKWSAIWKANGDAVNQTKLASLFDDGYDISDLLLSKWDGSLIIIVSKTDENGKTVKKSLSCGSGAVSGFTDFENAIPEKDWKKHNLDWLN